MSNIRKIVESNTAPLIQDLWLKDGVLYQFDTNGWVPINKVTDEDLERIREELTEEIKRSIGEDVAFKEDLQELLKAINKEIEDRKAADTTLQDNINEVQSNLDKEITDRVNAIDDTTKLIVELHAALGLTASPSIIYKGENNTVNISHSVTFKGNPINYTVTIDNTALSNPYTLSDSHTFNAIYAIDSTDPKVNTVMKKSVTVNAYYPRYYGRSAVAAISADEILALEKQPAASSAMLSNKTIGDDKSSYLWLCVPSGMTVKTVTSSGFSVPMEAPIVVAVPNKGNYNCYRSTSMANAGNVTYNIA